MSLHEFWVQCDGASAASGPARRDGRWVQQRCTVLALPPSTEGNLPPQTPIVNTMCFSPVLQALILRIYSLTRGLQLLWSRSCYYWHRAAAHCSCVCCGMPQRTLAPPDQIQRLRLR